MKALRIIRHTVSNAISDSDKVLTNIGGGSAYSVNESLVERYLEACKAVKLCAILIRISSAMMSRLMLLLSLFYIASTYQPPSVNYEF